MSPPVERVQRLIWEEFRLLGWTYDIDGCRRLAESLASDPSCNAGSLALSFSPYSLASPAPTRAEIVKMIERVRGSIRIAVTEVRSSLKLLFIAAGPLDAERLRLAAEHRDVRAALRNSTFRDDTAMEEALAARPTDLIEELNRFRPSVLHISGHGNSSGIALEDSAGLASEISTAQIASLVATADPALRLVVLNSCESAAQAEPITQHVDASIGMAVSIGDDAARTFAVQLYGSLSEGVPLSRAFEQAKLQLSLAGFSEDQTPQLYMKSGVNADQIRFTSI